MFAGSRQTRPGRSTRRPFSVISQLNGQRGETRLPMPERPVTVGDRQQTDMRDVVEHRDRRIEQAIAEGLFEVGERKQLFAQSEPSLSLNRRTQPTRSRPGRARSLLVATAGASGHGVEVAQHVQTRSRCVEDCALTMCGSGVSLRTRAECIEAALETRPVQSSDRLGSRSGAAVEFGRPFQEGLVAIGDRRQRRSRP